MKFLYIGDVHERATPPKNRKDNWDETFTSKVEEIRTIAKKHNVKAILHGGDFFSKHKYDTEFLSKVLKRWGYTNYNEKLLEEGVILKSADEAPIITPIGNHDLLGSSLKSYEKTSLAFLESIGFVTIANKERPLIFKEDDFSVAITGGHYELDMDETKEPYIIKEKQGDFHIHIVHGMLTDHKWPDGVPHTTLDEVLHTKADLTIAGHDHKGFPLFEHEGKLFVNPGSPVRMGTDEIKRKPKVMLVEVTKTGIKTKYIYLKTAKPGEEVLDLTEKEKKQRKSNTLRDIKEKIKESSRAGSSINEIIKTIALESNLNEEISQRAINRVSDKMNNSKSLMLDEEASELTKPYYITTLELVNFCSHERTTFNFSEGLNVFVGPTASGKTTCFRAFKWIYNDDGNSKRFIKKGENFCEATITTSHGYTITRFINPKGKKTKDGKNIKNGYEIIHPNGDVETTNTKGVERVREILSYKKLNLETKEVDLNFLEQGDSWFFIGNNYTTTDRAKMIGAIHKTHFVDLAIKDLEADNKRLNQRRDDKEEEVNKIQEKIDAFSYLADMKSNLELIHEKKERLIQLTEKKKKVEEILKKRDILELEMAKCDEIIENINLIKLQEARNKINSLRNKIQILEKSSSILKKQEILESNISKEDNIISSISLENIRLSKDKISKAKNNLEKYSSIKNILTKEYQLRLNIEECDKTISKINLNNINLAKTKLNTLKIKIDTLNKTQQILTKRDEILSEEKRMDFELEKINIKNLNKSKDMVIKLKDKIILREKLKQILIKRNTIEKDVAKINEEIEMSNEVLAKNISVYQELLTLNGKCPICNSKIDKIIAKQIAENKLHK